MSFDNSRFTFDPWKDYFGVVMEQGRVQLDSDWNEWLAELARRIQAGTMDTLGRAVYPATTPHAFKITASHDSTGNHIAIGVGRMYVDGLLAENHGPPAAAQWDPALDEMSGAPQITTVFELLIPVTVDYTQQPYLPGATLPAGNGPFLAYLDVWRRPVTYLEDPDLIDKAVGVDTTGRLQTVWQVKLLDVSRVHGVNCSTPDIGIAAWQSLIQPSAGELTARVVPSAPAGPCCLTSGTGYTGMENQFYRVEIHQKGTIGTAGTIDTATFKWSRDNASVATRVTEIASVTNTAGNPASRLTVQSTGRDEVLGFAPGNWIEITDDWQELNDQPGELHAIDSIDLAAKTITLNSPVSSTSFPTTNGQTDPARHTRTLRWDQSGKVYKSDGTVWKDLTGSTGDIPVPPAGTTLILENGITVTFALPANGSFHRGDFWTFAARTADGSVETLTQASPRGIHHHYARLSIVTFPTTATDCRVAWPPPTGNGCCECTVTVQPGDLTGGKTLQGILDQYQNVQAPTTICLMPGVYSLPSPLRFKSAHSNISIQASQEGSVTIRAQAGEESQFADGMVVLDNASNVSLRGMFFAVPLTPFNAPEGKFAGLPVQDLDPNVQVAINNLVVSIGVRPVNCSGLAIENCEFGFADLQNIANPHAVPFGVGIFAAGQSTKWRITGNTFAGVGTFLAGFLLAPSVAFTPQSSGRASLVERVAGSVPAGTFMITAEPAIVEESRAALAGFSVSRLQAVFARGSSAASLAANGGKVLPSFLDEAVFEGNSFDGLTVAALALTESQTVRCTGNHVDSCHAGFWFLSPLLSAAILADIDPQHLALIGLSIAMGYPLPQGDTTPAGQIVAVPAAPASVRIYTGLANYTDSQGDVWTADINASNAVTIAGGTLYQPPTPPTIFGATPAATDQALYQSERYGKSFSYTFKSLPKGFYQVKLKFAEIWYTDPSNNKGVRIFDVSINGAQVLTNFDVVSNAGGADTANDQLFVNIAPDPQGQIVVQFTGTSLGADTNAKISAVEVDPQWGGSVPSASGFVSFYAQLAQLAQQGFAGSQAPPLRLRMDGNEMRGLSSIALLVLGNDMVQTPSVSSLMMSGNRMEVGMETRGRFTGLRAATQTSTVGTIRFIPPPRFFSVYTAAIVLLTRCVVTGNMILNEQIDGASFLLEVGSSPTPEIMVSANVFQGRVTIQPPRYPSASNVPPPMNSWDFLNTVMG